MAWSERQRAMLQEMGIRLWQPSQALSTAAGAPLAAEPESPLPPPSALAERARAPVSPPPATAVPAPARRPSAVDQMDWPALREAVATCRACTLCERRQQTVFGVGHERAHWMLVGEAPGEQEDLQGEPFVGKAGQLLDAMLSTMTLTRAQASAEQQVFIANVLKCRPPQNRNPEPQEVAQCEPFLRRQVALVQPRLIVAMGRFAVQSLLQTQEPIGRLRGRVHRYEGVPVVVTYHPAYLLRNPLDKARSWEDLCLAREVYLRGG